MRTSGRGRRRTVVGCGLLIAVVVGCAPAVDAAPEGARPSDVSVGYGTQSRERVTSAVTSYVPTEVDRGGHYSVLHMLAVMGGAATLRRGPLLVIDGVPSSWNALDMLSPEEIARIDLLKDAGSAGIYGARGADGVVVITTRRASLR
jgi:TonB-dependent SusC/RagA subfamily outer membrane receptor